MTKSLEDIVGRWRGPGWPALEREFVARVSDARGLVDELDSSFSPAQLVDRLAPLSGLSENTKRAFRDAVHAVYKKQSGIVALKRSLEDAVSGVSEALERFCTVWGQPVSEAAEQEVRASWCELYRCAVWLRDELDRLPGGVVLP